MQTMIAKSQFAYEYIKERILTGQLSPKADISEKQIQEELGISRTPVHEALKRLEDDGFVETYSRKGTFVTDVTMETVRDLYETRLLIEPTITRNAVNLVPREWMEDLRRRLIEERPFLTREDIHDVMALDTELHTTVASYCSNSFLRNSLHLIYEHDRRIRLKTERNPAQVRFSQREHVVILDAMLAGDEERTEQLAREHVVHSRDLTYESLGFMKSGLFKLSELPV
nr:GntR family transcriptional regulator [uncultured Oscillibacter sp.]